MLLLLFYCYYYWIAAFENFSLFDLSYSQVPHIDDIPICLKLHNTVSLSNMHALSIQTRLELKGINISYALNSLLVDGFQ